MWSCCGVTCYPKLRVCPCMDLSTWKEWWLRTMIFSAYVTWYDDVMIRLKMFDLYWHIFRKILTCILINRLKVGIFALVYRVLGPMNGGKEGLLWATYKQTLCLDKGNKAMAMKILDHRHPPALIFRRPHHFFIISLFFIIAFKHLSNHCCLICKCLACRMIIFVRLYSIQHFGKHLKWLKYFTETFQSFCLHFQMSVI